MMHGQTHMTDSVQERAALLLARADRAFQTQTRNSFLTALFLSWHRASLAGIGF